ncbi:MAG TPA: hypothetical protein VK130_07410 [Steroidobacteraceae bacterium]|nr:hypothetical protein [Steroidobacteraceae bacterium]
MFSRSSKAVWVTLAAGALLSLGLSTGAMAETRWEKQHPRRDQVNDRLAHQSKRLHREVKEGEMTPAQAAALHRQDHKIRREERLMAGQNGGHITKLEQKSLNQQENAVSKEIGK